VCDDESQNWVGTIKGDKRIRRAKSHHKTSLQYQINMSSGLSPVVLSRHMPQSSAGQVISGLWIGNLMSVSHLDDIIHQSMTFCSDSNTSSLSNNKKEVVITVISVLSNPNLIRLATDLIEKQRSKKVEDCNRTIDIKHVIIQLKDTVDSDLKSVLPNALDAIDIAPLLGPNTNLQSTRDEKKNDNTQRICLVHCAKGASRSVSVVMAYLMSRHSDRFKSFDEALIHIRTVRPQASPNIGFALELRKFEKELKTNI